MKRLATAALLLLVGGAAVAWLLALPQPMQREDLPEHSADAGAGEKLFWAGGCASCHATPVNGKRAKTDKAKLLLGGGLELDTPYGVFRVPNISSHATDGIGGWSMLAFVNAMQRGVSPAGQHYYPAFPYTSYIRMSTAQVMDLKAYLDTLPAVEGSVAGHSLSFPWSLRRGIGLWKRLYLNPAPVAPLAGESASALRGRELVEGAGHCGECHTPRDRFGGMDGARWLGGGPNPDGPGRVPNITPGGENVSEWSVADISYYLESGFTPDFDSVGGSMVAVQENLAKLSGADRDAIAAYLKAVPAVPE